MDTLKVTSSVLHVDMKRLLQYLTNIRTPMVLVHRSSKLREMKFICIHKGEMISAIQEFINIGGTDDDWYISCDSLLYSMWYEIVKIDDTLKTTLTPLDFLDMIIIYR